MNLFNLNLGVWEIILQDGSQHSFVLGQMSYPDVNSTTLLSYPSIIKSDMHVQTDGLSPTILLTINSLGSYNQTNGRVSETNLVWSTGTQTYEGAKRQLYRSLV